MLRINNKRDLKMSTRIVVCLIFIMVGLLACNDPGGYASRAKEGARAFRAGIPVSANPYSGRYGAKDWLDGFITEKEKQ